MKFSQQIFHFPGLPLLDQLTNNHATLRAWICREKYILGNFLDNTKWPN